MFYKQSQCGGPNSSRCSEKDSFLFSLPLSFTNSLILLSVFFCSVYSLNHFFWKNRDFCCCCCVGKKKKKRWEIVKRLMRLRWFYNILTARSIDITLLYRLVKSCVCTLATTFLLLFLCLKRIYQTQQRRWRMIRKREGLWGSRAWNFSDQRRVLFLVMLTVSSLHKVCSFITFS